jgi:serine O-acetyltransferase
MFDNLRRDTRRLRAIKSKSFPWYVIESLLFENGYQAVVLHRIAHWFRSRGIPFFGPLLARLNLLLTGADIAPAAEIGPGLQISHGVGLVIGDGVKIGSDANLLHQVTIGAPSVRRIEQMPVLGDRVFVAAGAKLIGAVRVGDDVFIGANALVVEDVPAGSKVTLDARVRIEAPEAKAVESESAGPSSV